MSATLGSPQREQVEPPVRARVAELVRNNELFLEEVRKLQRENVELMRRLHAAILGSQQDREIRRAALNLMEDAVAARRATEQENIERLRAEAELREADRRKDEFLATLAHELRTPLAPIRNSLHILRLGGANSGGAGRILDMMERQVNHVVRLVDDLLEVSRITRGKIELRKEEVELAAVVRSAVETCKWLLEDRQHQLAISLPAEPVFLEADPVRLSQVLANLLNNAAKYTQDRGQIWLTASCVGPHLEVTVRDTGIGIPANMLPKVFDLFTQVDRTYDRAQGGLGIGLTLVRSLVELHGGRVEAKSEGPGLGSDFVIRLPLGAGHAHHKVVRRDHGPHMVFPYPIVVVDDNPDATASMSLLLGFLGAKVHTVNDSKAALDTIRTYRPKVVLLDIGMPEMDGFEVARRVRQLPECRDMTLIALTGYGQEEDRRRSQAAGFNYHLVKPIEFSVLEDLLAEVLRDHSSSSGAGSSLGSGPHLLRSKP
jgi:signal transduction histidine kinase/ActR/RegA family two-component response regulator